MLATLDVGSNTVRMLVGEVRDRRVQPLQYERRITRLGGGFSPDAGLAREARERTLAALRELSMQLGDPEIEGVRAVGTEAFRKAANGPQFAERIRSETGLPLRIIDGDEEALLTSRGVRSALVPKPETSLIFDLGGGSTEFILCHGDEIHFHRSYPIGVVSLCEETPSSAAQQQRIDRAVRQFIEDLFATPLRKLTRACPLVGTAGTVTTLAALHLEMDVYDWQRINNVSLTRADLAAIDRRLTPLTVPEREALPGIEPGRGDLILPGLRLILAIMDGLGHDQVLVSDFGLLEGLLLAAAE